MILEELDMARKQKPSANGNSSTALPPGAASAQSPDDWHDRLCTWVNSADDDTSRIVMNGGVL